MGSVSITCARAFLQDWMTMLISCSAIRVIGKSCATTPILGLFFQTQNTILGSHVDSGGHDQISAMAIICSTIKGITP
ncbi:hypothetical protein SAMN05216227_10728 [Pseudorhodobacter antarcticus]|uniref:Uncharacterized protein n=1 Tax=Pseudorhodobacter antarcticus TaxID=1077947 RepID=A0A1H8N6X4_9RHOB|nr:hypothetical protein SAMN05216227_10728 [Pseudorhodobacter antarcticus]